LLWKSMKRRSNRRRLARSPLFGLRCRKRRLANTIPGEWKPAPWYWASRGARESLRAILSSRRRRQLPDVEEPNFCYPVSYPDAVREEE
jgi:hypothetical protein